VQRIVKYILILLEEIFPSYFSSYCLDFSSQNESDRICFQFFFIVRTGFLFTAVVTGIFGFLSALSPNYICLLTLRFVVGMGLGAGHVLATWFLEFVPAAKRGTWVVVFHCTWTFGTIFQALIAWVIFYLSLLVRVK
jgi:MFS family permease